MTKKIIAFGASSSRQSINKKLATYTAHQVKNAAITILDLNDFEMPIYSIDRQNEDGFPEQARQFKAQIAAADGIIISFAEHNGSFSAAYKNIYDWVSRLEQDVWMQKPMFLLGTSPGERGAKTVLEFATNAYKRGNKNTIASFSLPSFHQNFTENIGIKEESLALQFEAQLVLFTNSL